MRTKKTKYRNLIWTTSISMQNFLGERGIFPVDEDFYSNKVGYEPTKEVKDAMESYHIRQMFYQKWY